MEDWITNSMNEDSGTFLLIVLFGGCMVFLAYSIVRNPKEFLKYVWKWLTTKEEKKDEE